MGRNDKTKKKIIFVISTLNTGGAQRAFANISLGLSSLYECVFLLNDAEEITYPFSGKILDMGFPKQTDKTGLFYQLRVFIRRYFWLKKLKKSGEYVACISGLTSANAVNVLTKDDKCKSIISVRIFSSKDRLKGIKNMINTMAIKVLYNKADVITTVSESAKYDLVKNYSIAEDKICTIYNGYHLLRIQELMQESLSDAEELWFQENQRMIVTMGRLTAQKGQWHLIRAMKRICEKMQDVKLLILGEGELKEKLEMLVEECGLQNTVFFGGFCTNPYRVLAKCDLFVLPSLYEGFPNALMEAMCCGVPVVAADFDSGAREILAPQTDIMYKVETTYEKAEYGILCPQMDGIYREAGEELAECETQLSAAIYDILNDCKLYTEYKNQSRLCAERFTMSAIAHQWERLIG